MRYRQITYHYNLVTRGPAFGQRQGIVVAPAAWRPAADVFETAGGLWIIAEIAGVEEEDIEVVIFNNAVVIQGERHYQGPHEDGSFHAAELRCGRFQLEVPLPGAVDAANASAVYERGMLRLRLPKAAVRPQGGTA
jgi:HSP20 family protein